MLQPTPFLGSAYTSRSPVLNAQRMVNLYTELVETQDGKEPGGLYGTPGLDLLATIGAGPWRGLRTVNGTLYGVSGASLYRINSGFTGNIVGTLATATGPVGMVNNSTQLLLVDGQQAYAYDTNTSVFDVVGLPFTGAGPVVCAYQDGFGLINEAGTQQWWQSNLNDMFVWGGLNFSSADGQPDPIVSMIDKNREVWLFGASTTEVWINAGNPNFAFQRLQGVFEESGIVAPYSAAVAGDSVLWLARSARGQGQVMQSRGYQVGPVSTAAVTRAIQSYERIDDAIGYCYQQESHTFYVLTFPTADATWCLDINDGLWHERPWFENAYFHRHRSNCFAAFNGQLVVGDWENGNLYAFNLDTYTDAGQPIKRLRSWQVLPTGKTSLRKMALSLLQLYVQPGVGTVLPPGDNPQIMLRMSWTGGLSFGNERQMSVGKIGEVGWRVLQRRLGNGYDPVAEVSTIEPCKMAWLTAFADIEPGTG